MANPAIKTLQLTGNGASTQNSNPLPLNLRSSPFHVGIGVSTDGSTTGYTVQYTFNDPSEGLSGATWFDHPDLSGKVANADGNIAFPVTAVRLCLNASGTDTVTARFIQAGVTSSR